jgi:hypothetical protein
MVQIDDERAEPVLRWIEKLQIKEMEAQPRRHGSSGTASSLERHGPGFSIAEVIRGALVAMLRSFIMLPPDLPRGRMDDKTV